MGTHACSTIPQNTSRLVMHLIRLVAIRGVFTFAMVTEMGAVFPHLTFFPGHFCPKGCTERKLECDRPRPTTDGSNPPCHTDGTARVFDTAGQPVYSPNWRARRAALSIATPGEVCKVRTRSDCILRAF